ncbi:dihydrolipoamide acetyltransferase family protein [Amphritea pacifica]|uniref:Dihydrolipoamide acetyltransferase component of pyruvate dehydrogenase complex n=1 Tax=Amphritea pacifica TaxID=2811233 RepID=A0ABS2WAR9_9GAMM|nr:dihydrolipoamide acetyltransferase family protein [Amphritea pacifica]MBN0988820.1 2-oxo acid dehydrogenase subunit E2 [Amphritea pacifica]MBN1006283.1 2-oxo acid dehydrogenase subunit E2 [Amphritea pacifica]
MKYFKLPDLGEGLPEAEIVEWKINEGDQVKADQILATVETAKAIIEIPSPQDGVIAHLFGQAGDTIHTGEPLLEFAGEEDDSGTVVGELKRETNSAARDDFFIGAAPSTRAHSQQMTPAVRSLANRLNVDTENLKGSGRNGQLTSDDIERMAKTDRTHGKAAPLRGVRKQMARNMAQAHAEVVPVTLHEDADINGWAAGEDITMRLIHAIAAGCKAEPALNTWFDGQQLARRVLSQINLGVAVDTEKGLFVPVLRDIGNRSLDDIREGLNRLRQDVIERTIPPSELQGGTITLSNFGTIAGRYASPIVVPPTVAILGAGVIRDQVMPVAGEIAIRRVMPLSLTFDHRAATGGEAARFMRAVISDLAKESIS